MELEPHKVLQKWMVIATRVFYSTVKCLSKGYW